MHYFFYTSIFIILANIGWVLPVNSQSVPEGIPFIQNYTKEDYKTSENQHWAVIQNKEGLTFYGNNEGLLIFDGSHWELLDLPNKSVVRSLAMDSKGTVYVGGKNEFGKLTGTPELGYTYVSLSDSLPTKDKIMEDVWRIFVDDKDKVFFQSFASVVVMDTTGFNVLYPKDKFHLSFFVNNSFYVNERDGRGILVYKNNELQPVSNAKELAQYSIYNLLPFNKQEVLVVTRSRGTFLYNLTTGTIRIDTTWNATNKVLKKASIFSAAKYGTDTFLFGTLREGLVIVKQGKIQQFLNKNFGLIDNTVWNIYINANKNVFLALDNGISYIFLNSSVRFFDQAYGVENGVLAIEKFQNQLFLGTIDGILTVNPKGDFSLVGKDNGFIWQLKIIDNNLYASSYNGLLKLNQNGTFDRVGPKEYVWKVVELKKHPNKVLAGTRDGGLLLFEKTTEGLKYLKKVKGFNRSSRWIEEDNQGRVWVTHYNRGVTMLSLSSAADSVIGITQFSPKNGLPSNTNNYVFRSKRFGNGNGVIFGTENGAYHFDDSQGRFIKIKALEKLKGERYLNQYIEYQGNKAAYQYGDHIGVIHFDNDSIEKINVAPFAYFASNFCDVINSTSENELFFGTDQGLYLYSGQEDDRATAKKFDLIFRKLMLGGKKYNSYNSKIEVPYKENTFVVQYTLPTYIGNRSTKFQYKLEGFDENWSNWSNSKLKEYTNLHEGTYRFLARSKTIGDVMSPTKSFTFSIKPPYYRTLLAYVVYFLTIVLIIWNIVKYSLKRAEWEKKRLQQLVDERTSKLYKQNIELKELHTEKDNILDIVAHDLRAPFQQIKGLTHLINVDNSLSKEKEGYLQKIEKVINRGNQLINDLLDVSSVQKEKELKVEAISIHQVLTNLEEQFKVELSVKEQSINYHITNNLTTIHSDKHLLWRLLENLLSNAIKYSPKGAIIDIKVGYENELVVFTIKDEGPGFSKEDQELMFKKFQKLSARPTNNESSTGLGLSIVKIIIEKLGARIDVKTELGKGTEFIIKIPNK